MLGSQKDNEPDYNDSYRRYNTDDGLLSNFLIKPNRLSQTHHLSNTIPQQPLTYLIGHFKTGAPEIWSPGVEIKEREDSVC